LQIFISSIENYKKKSLTKRQINSSERSKKSLDICKPKDLGKYLYDKEENKNLSSIKKIAFISTIELEQAEEVLKKKENRDNIPFHNSQQSYQQDFAFKIIGLLAKNLMKVKKEYTNLKQRLEN